MRLTHGFDEGRELNASRRFDSAPLPALDGTAPHGDPMRIYGEANAGAGEPMHTMTPTRLLPHGPTPSAELSGGADDLHVPAIIRMTQGRLPIE